MIFVNSGNLRRFQKEIWLCKVSIVNSICLRDEIGKKMPKILRSRTIGQSQREDTGCVACRISVFLEFTFNPEARSNSHNMFLINIIFFEFLQKMVKSSAKAV